MSDTLSKRIAARYIGSSLKKAFDELAKIREESPTEDVSHPEKSSVPLDEESGVDP